MLDKNGGVVVWIVVLGVLLVLGFGGFYFLSGGFSFSGPRSELLLLLERYDAASCFESKITETIETDGYIDFRVDMSVVFMEKLIESSLVYRYDKSEAKFVSVISDEPVAGEKSMPFGEMISAIESAEKQREEKGLSCEEEKEANKNRRDLSERCFDAVMKFIIDGTCTDAEGVHVVMRKIRDDSELGEVRFFVNSDYVDKDFSEEEFLITYSELGVDSVDEIKFSSILSGEVCTGVSTKPIGAC